jgi:hypothetical protein
MAYVDPTAAEIKTRFPEFAAVADATIDAVIAESAGSVSERWIENDFKTAKMYYVAHELRMAGQGSSAAAKLSAVGDFSRIKSGDLEVSRSGAGSSSSSGDSSDGTFKQTTYGQKFLELRSRSFPSIMTF